MEPCLPGASVRVETLNPKSLLSGREKTLNPPCFAFEQVEKQLRAAISAESGAEFWGFERRQRVVHEVYIPTEPCNFRVTISASVWAYMRLGAKKIESQNWSRHRQVRSAARERRCGRLLQEISQSKRGNRWIQPPRSSFLRATRQAAAARKIRRLLIADSGMLTAPACSC